MKDLCGPADTENDDVAALDGLKAVNKFVDEDAFLVGEQRGHAGAFDFYRLIEEDYDDQRQADGDEQIARPNTNSVRRECEVGDPEGGVLLAGEAGSGDSGIAEVGGSFSSALSIFAAMYL